MNQTVILLGDSVFDNTIYVKEGQADVKTNLKKVIDPKGWDVELRAVDGALVEDVPAQLNSAPIMEQCTYILSAGGNNALEHIGMFDYGMMEDKDSKFPFKDAMKAFHKIKEDFRKSYVEALDEILSHNKPLIVCTIYNPKFPDPELQIFSEAALSFFNDVIVEEALKRKLPIIDLRDVCQDSECFANPIEPSEHGGMKIAEAIDVLLTKQS